MNSSPLFSIHACSLLGADVGGAGFLQLVLVSSPGKKDTTLWYQIGQNGPWIA